MKKKTWIFAVILLVFASLACNLFNGLGKTAATPEGGAGDLVVTEDAGEQPTMESSTPEDSTPVSSEPTQADDLKKHDTEFPLPADISGFTDMGNGTINFQAKISVKDAIAFYRDNFATAGYKERSINTAITDTTFSLVFDGHSSGKAIVVQGVDLGGGSVNINIRFEDV